jgi:hypothetical protein
MRTPTARRCTSSVAFPHTIRHEFRRPYHSNVARSTTKFALQRRPPAAAADGAADLHWHCRRISARGLHASPLLLRSRAHRNKHKRPDYTSTRTGLQYVDEVVGDGETPQSGSKVTVHYTGSLTDGKVFDSSHGRGPFSFNIGKGQVIEGWDEGIMGMRCVHGDLIPSACTCHVDLCALTRMLPTRADNAVFALAHPVTGT